MTPLIMTYIELWLLCVTLTITTDIIIRALSYIRPVRRLPIDKLGATRGYKGLGS